MWTNGSTLLWYQRKHAQRTAGAVLDLERGGHDHRAGPRKLIEIAQALQAIAPATVQEMVRRIRRLEMTGLAGIRPDRLGAEADDAALLDEPAHHGSIQPGCVRAVVLQVGVVAPTFLRPVGAEQHPMPFRNPPVALFQGLDDWYRQKDIRVR